MEKSTQPETGSVPIQIEIRCLVFKEFDKDENKDVWNAVALGCDIWGVGDTKDEAMADLNELLDAHIEFVVDKNAIHMLDHPTEQKYFNMWDEQREERNKTLHKHAKIARQAHQYNSVVA